MSLGNPTKKLLAPEMPKLHTSRDRSRPETLFFPGLPLAVPQSLHNNPEDSMNREERIEKLVKTPPRIVLTPWQKTERVITWLTTIVATIAFVLAIFSMQQTAQEARSSKISSTCINKVLATRRASGLQQVEAAAIYAEASLKWNQFIKDELANPPRSKAERKAASKKFTQLENAETNATALWLAKLQGTIDVSKSAPLGQC